jgi:hypothetical protein
MTRRHLRWRVALSPPTKAQIPELSIKFTYGGHVYYREFVAIIGHNLG